METLSEQLLCGLTSLPPWHYDSAVKYAVESLRLSEVNTKCMKACLIVGWLSSEKKCWEPIVNNTLEVMKDDLLF
jgi:hypothetical protein